MKERTISISTAMLFMFAAFAIGILAGGLVTEKIIMKNYVEPFQYDRQEHEQLERDFSETMKRLEDAEQSLGHAFRVLEEKAHGISIRAIEEGIASWYGPVFHGRQAADGSLYNMHAFTAASRTMPLGTMALVENLENGRSIVVRITDRGPYIDGRIIDLSFAAANKLGMAEKGITPVRVTTFEIRQGG